MTLGPWLPLPEQQTRHWRYEARSPLSGTMEGVHTVAIPRTRTPRIGGRGWQCGRHGYGPEIGDAGKDAADRCAAEAGWELCDAPAPPVTVWERIGAWMLGEGERPVEMDDDRALVEAESRRCLEHVPRAPVRDDGEG